MKFTPEHLKLLRITCLDTLSEHKISVDKIKTTALAWQVFCKASYEHRFLFVVYDYYNDVHITTALRKIFNIKIAH